MDGERSEGLWSHLVAGLGASTRHNGLAYGYSLATTGAFGILTASAGHATPLDIMLFGLAGAASFTLATATTTRGFRHRPGDEPPIVRALGSSFSFISIPGAIAAAWLFGALLPRLAAWTLGGFAVSAVYLILSGIEVALARVLRPRLPTQDLAEPGEDP